MIKEANSVLKTAAAAKLSAVDANQKLIARAGDALKFRAARKLSTHFAMHPRDPFGGSIKLVSVDTMRSSIAAALGSSLHKAVDAGLVDSIAGPLTTMLKDKGYNFALKIEDHRWTSEESDNTYGAKYLTLKVWPAETSRT
jgi:hypothetical protein